MALARTFQELKIWQLAKELSLEIYRVTTGGRLAKDFGMKDQMQRASVSVMSNIAEGFERWSKKDFAHFLTISLGSLAELKSLCYLASALKYLDADTSETIDSKCDHLRASIRSMM